MNAKKILLGENKEKFIEIKKALIGNCELRNQIIEAYEGLDIGEFTEDTWKIILKRGAAKSIEAQYWAAQEQNLTETGVLNKVLRNSILDLSRPPIDLLTGLIRSFEGSKNNDEIYGHIEFIDGEFEITATGNDLMELYCREYLADPGEAEFLQALEAVVTACEAYRKVATKITATYQLSRSMGAFDWILRSKDNKWYVDPAHAIAYYRMAVHNQKHQQHAY